MKLTPDQIVAMNQAAARKAHFEKGGTPAMWRKREVRFRDKKHEDDKKACRRKPEED